MIGCPTFLLPLQALDLAGLQSFWATAPPRAWRKVCVARLNGTAPAARRMKAESARDGGRLASAALENSRSRGAGPSEPLRQDESPQDRAGQAC